MGARAPLRLPWHVGLAGLVLGGLLLLELRTPELSPDARFIAVVLLFAAVAAAYLLWQVDLAYGVAAAIALSVFSGNWNALGLPGFPFLPDRLLFAVALLGLVLRAPAPGRPRFVLRPVHWLLGLVLLYALCSALFAGTLGSSSAIFALLDRLGVVPFGLFLVAPLVFFDTRRRNVLLLTLLGLGTYLGVTAFFEVVGPSSLVVPRYIADPSYGILFGRARGPFVETQTNGFALFACAIAAVIVLGTWRDRRLRLWAAVVLPLSLLGCLLTLQRAVWIAVVVGAAVAMLSHPGLRRHLPAAAAAAALLVLFAFTVLPGVAGHAEQRAADQIPVWDRQNQNAAALRMIGERPLLGFGWNRFSEDSTPYFVQSDDIPLTGYGLVVHNIYLSNAVELGLVGATLWAVALVCAIGGAIVRRVRDDLRAWQSGLMALAAFWLVVALFNPLQQSFSELILWTWAGVVMAGAAVPRVRRG